MTMTPYGTTSVMINHGDTLHRGECYDSGPRPCTSCSVDERMEQEIQWPHVASQGGEATLKLKHFWFLDVQWKPQIYPLL